MSDGASIVKAFPSWSNSALASVADGREEHVFPTLRLTGGRGLGVRKQISRHMWHPPQV